MRGLGEIGEVAQVGEIGEVEEKWGTWRHMGERWKRRGTSREVEDMGDMGRQVTARWG